METNQAPGQSVDRAGVLRSFRNLGEQLMQTLGAHLPQPLLDEAYGLIARATTLATTAPAASQATTTRSSQKMPAAAGATKPPTEAQQKILDWLAKHPNSTQAQIAAGVGVRINNIARSIEGILESGLVGEGPNATYFLRNAAPEARAA